MQRLLVAGHFHIQSQRISAGTNIHGVTFLVLQIMKVVKTIIFFIKKKGE